MDKYVFSAEANIGTGGEKPMMLGRFLGGVLHPAIHTGHIEFNQPGMVAEGMRYTRSNTARMSALMHLKYRRNLYGLRHDSQYKRTLPRRVLH